MIIHTCDRCGKTLEETGKMEINIYDYRFPWHPNPEFELCPFCASEFEKWMRNVIVQDVAISQA